MGSGLCQQRPSAHRPLRHWQQATAPPRHRPLRHWQQATAPLATGHCATGNRPLRHCATGHCATGNRLLHHCVTGHCATAPLATPPLRHCPSAHKATAARTPVGGPACAPARACTRRLLQGWAVAGHVVEHHLAQLLERAREPEAAPVRGHPGLVGAMACSAKLPARAQGWGGGGGLQGGGCHGLQCSSARVCVTECRGCFMVAGTGENKPLACQREVCLWCTSLLRTPCTMKALRTCTHSHMCTHTHAHRHTYVCTHTRTHTHACVHVHTLLMPAFSCAAPPAPSKYPAQVHACMDNVCVPLCTAPCPNMSPIPQACAWLMVGRPLPCTMHTQQVLSTTPGTAAEGGAHSQEAAGAARCAHRPAPPQPPCPPFPALPSSTQPPQPPTNSTPACVLPHKTSSRCPPAHGRRSCPDSEESASVHSSDPDQQPGNRTDGETEQQGACCASGQAQTQAMMHPRQGRGSARAGPEQLLGYTPAWAAGAPACCRSGGQARGGGGTRAWSHLALSLAPHRFALGWSGSMADVAERSACCDRGRRGLKI